MTRKINKFLNVRVLLIISCMIIFILINSIQENFIGVDDIAVSNLSTTNFGNTNTTEYPTTTTSAPTLPPETPTTPPGNVQIDEEPAIPSQILPITISVGILVLVFLLLFRKRREVRRTSGVTTSTVSSLLARREKFRTNITTLVDVLYEFLEQKRFSEGIIFGYHHLDRNMKRVLGIKRDAYLTPKEFSQSLDLPEIVTHLSWMIQSFYLARYKIADLEHDDLKGFIERLQKMKKLSVSKADIEIIKTDLMGDDG